MLAATVRVTRDLDLAEECVQDAYAQALRDLGRARRPGAAGRVADHRGPAPGAGPAAPRGDAAPGAAAARATTSRPGRTRTAPVAVTRRPAAAGLHLLPPGARAGGAGRADPAAAVRAHHGRGGRAFLVERADDGGPDHAGQEEDRRRPHPVPGAVGRAELPDAHRAPCWPSCTCCSPPGTPRRSAPTWCGATWSSGRSTWPGCCAALLPRRRRRWPALLALILLTDARRDDPGRPGRAAAAARRAGPDPVGRGRDRGGRSTWSRRRCGAGRRSRLRLRPRSRRCTPRRRPGRTPTGAEVVGLYDVLVEVWPSPVVALNRAVGGRVRARARPRGWRRWSRWRRAAARRLRLPAGGARATFLAALGRVGRGAAGVRGGAPADRERRRAGVPGRAARRAGPPVTGRPGSPGRLGPGGRWRRGVRRTRPGRPVAPGWGVGGPGPAGPSCRRVRRTAGRRRPGRPGSPGSAPRTSS